MLKNNTMRFGSDGFSFRRQALLTSKQPFDTANQTAVEGFTITGDEPSGTSRRFMFKVDDKLWKFNAGSLVEHDGDGDFEDILANGNTYNQLAAVNSIPAWLGKKIYPLIALDAPVDATALPTAKISLKVRASTELYQKTVESPEYDLSAASGGTPRIAEINCSTTCTGNATAAVTCRLKNAEGEWGSWMNLTDAKDQEAIAVQFQMLYSVTTLNGADSAKVDSITVKHTLGAAAVSGDVAEVYSIVRDYEHDLKTCYVVVKHKPLIDSRIEAFVNFMHQTKKRTLIPLGTSTGIDQQFYLGVDGVRDFGIDQSTIQLFADGAPLSNFDYNVAEPSVTINTTAGKAITASYEYDHAQEEWREMSRQIDQQPYPDGSMMTRFTYTLPDDESLDQKLSNIRLKLYRPEGRVTRESLGVASGAVQQFVLAHQAKQDTIELNGDWSYDSDSQILTVVGTLGTELIISYDWLGESQVLYSWTAGWSPV